MDIGIVGATGNIGQRVVRAAVGRGHRVTGFTRDLAKLKEADPSISWKAIDVFDADSVRRAIGGLVGERTNKRISQSTPAVTQGRSATDPLFDH
jgi:putative NADH-flavin reductase